MQQHGASLFAVAARVSPPVSPVPPHHSPAMKALPSRFAALARTLGCSLALLATLRLPAATPPPAPAPAAPAQPAPPAPATPAVPKVLRLDGSFGVGNVVQVQVDNLATWVAAGHDANKLVPFINGRALIGEYPVEVHNSDKEVFFQLDVTPANRDVWLSVMGPLNVMKKEVEFSVGLENDAPFATVLKGPLSPVLTVVQQPYGFISFLMVVGTLVGLIALAIKTDLLRDVGPCPLGKKNPYSLGRVQMAFWFFLTVTSYIAIWLITDAIDTITPSLLGLMGISASTALGEVLIDQSKDATAVANYNTAVAQKYALEQGIAEQQAQLAALTGKATPAPDDAAARDSLNRQLLDQRTQLNQLQQQLKSMAPSVADAESEGFLRDVLRDGCGYSFHRFQIFIWTLVLGGVFISRVYNNLTMPEFSATMLGLMGMSSGTYIGFKFPETR